MRFRSKIKQTSGAMLLILAVVAAIIVLLVVIAIPVMQNIREENRRRVDQEYQQAAIDSAILNLLGEDTRMIYDAKNKSFVQTDQIEQVEDYAEAKIHQGMVLLVTVTAGGDVSAEWVEKNSFSF